MSFKIWSLFWDEYWQDLRKCMPEVSSIQKENFDTLWLVISISNKRNYYELDENFQKYFSSQIRGINDKKLVSSIKQIIALIQTSNIKIENIIQVKKYEKAILTLNDILDDYINTFN